MPRRHFGHDGIGDGTDQIRRHLNGVRLLQERLDLADRQPARVARDDFVIEASEPPLVFANQLRLERPLAIARDLNRQGPIVGEDRLAAGAVALIRGERGLGGAGWVAKVVGQLAAQRSLNQSLLEASRRGLDFLGGQRTSRTI